MTQLKINNFLMTYPVLKSCYIKGKGENTRVENLRELTSPRYFFYKKLHWRIRPVCSSIFLCFSQKLNIR